MRIIAKSTLREFWLKHADSEQPLKAWYQEAGKSVWKHPNDIKAEYPSASILGANRVVFNIKGNSYRLIVKINYHYQWFGSALLAPIQNTIKLTQIQFKKMNIKPIKSETDYQEAIQRLAVIFDASPNTNDGDELEILGLLIDDYEKTHFPIDLPDPIEAIKFRMDQMNISNNDLAKIIGLKSRVSEILNKKRRLSINMIRKLHDALHIPNDVLVQKY